MQVSPFPSGDCPSYSSPLHFHTDAYQHTLSFKSFHDVGRASNSTGTATYYPKPVPMAVVPPDSRLGHSRYLERVKITAAASHGLVLDHLDIQSIRADITFVWCDVCGVWWVAGA